MIALVITLIIIGGLLYLEEKYIGPKIDPLLQKIIRVVVIVCVVVWLLYQFGILPFHNDVPVPKLRA